MGTTASKPETKSNRRIKNSNELEYAFVELYCDSDVKKDKINKLQKEYFKNVHMFLLNQVLFSVLISPNYEKELAELSMNDTGKRLTELNLTEELFLTCLKPDDVFTLVNKHVRFKAIHGANKDIESPLVTNRIFVIHENIQIIADGENDYAHIDKPSLEARVIEKTRAGYVKLRYIEDLKFKRNTSSNSSFHSTQDDSSSYGSDDTKTETYGRITQARTLKPMPLSPEKLKKMLYPVTEIQLPDTENDDNLFLYEYYVNSKHMAELFHQNWTKISELLGLDEQDRDKAEFNCDSIFCYSGKTNTMWEIIAAVQLPKYGYGAFIHNKRKAIDEMSAILQKYTFPSITMLPDIAELDTLAIPRGFIPKYRDERNPEYHLEWELAHPKAERYFQNAITKSHMKLFLMLMLLHKSFIEPKTNTQGITIRHIVTHLFWELQRNVLVSESKMGPRFVEVLQSLCKRLGTGVLPDYFVEERNHFANVPSPRLRAAQEVISDAKDAPLIFLISALRNLHYVDENIPKLDVKELYEHLTRDTFPEDESDDEYNTSMEMVEEPQRKTNLDWETKMRRTIHAQKLEKLMEDNLKNKEEDRKISVDSIDYGFEANKLNDRKHAYLWRLKSKDVLSLFINHFMEMAKQYHKFNNTKQCESYLKQAEYLTHLFHISHTEVAQNHNDAIVKLANDIKYGKLARNTFEHVELRVKANRAPELPERGSTIHIPTVRLFNNNQVDMKNILEQHQAHGETRNYIRNGSHDSSESKSPGHRSKIVSFGSDVQVTKINSKSSSKGRTSSETKKLKVGQNEIEIDNTINKPSTSVVDDVTEKSDSDSDNFDEDDLLGLDEIASDDDDDGITELCDTRNPFEQNIQLTHDYKDSFT